MFPNKLVTTLPVKRVQDKTLGINLGLNRPVNVSDVKGNNREFGGEKALDGDPNTYWCTNEGTHQ